MVLPCGWDDCGIGRSVWLAMSLRLKAECSRRLNAAGGERDSLLSWGKRFLPHHFSRQPSAMHRWLAERLDSMVTARGERLNVIGPRGGAKSTVVTLAHVLRSALEGWEPYIWIVSDTRQQACLHLRNIKAEIEGNSALAEAYPHAAARGRVWRDHVIELAGGAAIEALGRGQGLRGKRHGAFRPTLVICDDIENDSHSRSAVERASSRQWFEGTLLKAGDTRTNIVNLATALHRDALALVLDRTPGWTSRVFPSIVSWPLRMELWQEWEQVYCRADDPAAVQHAREFYGAHRGAMDEGAEVLWPDGEDLYTLMCMRVAGGKAAFEREKQGVPLNPESCEWPAEYFDGPIWFDEWPADGALRVVALDPSKGRQSAHGDYSAFVMLAIDSDGVLHVDADIARRATPEMVAAGAEICQRFVPHAFGVETNQFQELLAGELQAEFRRRALHHLQPWGIDNRVNKQVRIRRLGPYLAARRLRFLRSSPGARLLVEQLQTFPAGDHDDGPDALEMAIRLAGELAGGAHGDGLGDRLAIAVA